MGIVDGAESSRHAALLANGYVFSSYQSIIFAFE
jgi:hypothetical protein